jgi:esterase/lipase superfamily enzyme
VADLTLYASAKDRALNASMGFHRYPRAGDAAPGIFVQKQVESIDASSVDTDFLGHSYVAESLELIEDLKQLIKEDRLATKRNGLLPHRVGATLQFWEIVKAPPIQSK